MAVKPIRVLLVDDDQDDFLFTRESLAEVAPGGFQVDWVATYDAAVEAIQRKEHEVYLVDYRLGPRSGLELLREMIGKGIQAPMLLLTGQGDRDIDLEAMQAGAADYVAKGWSGTLLERSIRYAIAHKQAEEALQKMRAELEVRVQERTAQLAQANKELHVEVGERKRVEEKLRLSLREKEVLLREIHHRVKNNLQVICSLLKLESQQVQDPQALEVFKDSQDRIRSMALIHEKLFVFGDLARIDFSRYVHTLADYLYRAYVVDARNISLRINVEDVFLPIDAVTPCALLIHELVSNALRHAFPAGRGEIAIDFHKEDSGKFTLGVRDNGIGLHKEFGPEKPSTLGMQLVTALTDQLDGVLHFENTHGVSVKITFPSPEYRERGAYHGQCTSARG